MDKGIRHLVSCALINGSNRGTGNIHPKGTGLLCEPFIIQ